jgi:hypothetical protein
VGFTTETQKKLDVWNWGEVTSLAE